ncbi:hypothetical protein D3C86_1262970 [compost metagenome]
MVLLLQAGDQLEGPVHELMPRFEVAAEGPVQRRAVDLSAELLKQARVARVQHLIARDGASLEGVPELLVDAPIGGLRLRREGKRMLLEQQAQGQALGRTEVQQRVIHIEQQMAVLLHERFSRGMVA